jgi:transcriptional regulator with XRE-family HTH domain
VRKPGRLTGAKFRFLRTAQELSQKGLGELIGCDVQQIHRWENGKTRVPRWADRILRVVWREYAEGNARIRGFVDRIDERDAKDGARRRFARDRPTWTEAAQPLRAFLTRAPAAARSAS